jgi:hypothetical protein
MDSPAPFTMKLPLDRVTALSMEPGTVVGLSGQVTASLDGTSLDAASLFDFAAGGLRVVDTDPAHFAYVLAPTGQVAPACAAVGGLPCLVPRLAVLAHERLHTSAELVSTFSGSIELESHPRPSAVPAILGALALAAVVIGLALGTAWVALAVSRRAGRTAMGRIRVAARRALRATRGDATLDGARTQIRALFVRARQLDAQRRDSARKLARIDRDALERRADACARSTVPVAPAALASFSAEHAAAVQLESDHRSVIVELERIESVLRTAALRVGGAAPGARDGVRARLGSGGRTLADPVDALVTELDLRDEALAEADAF